MKFAVGDRVRIIATGCENNGHGPHYGELGTIKAAYKYNRIPYPYVVIRDHSPKETGICYDESSLEELGHTKMTPPDMTLEEIEMADMALEEASLQRG